MDPGASSGAVSTVNTVPTPRVATLPAGTPRTVPVPAPPPAPTEPGYLAIDLGFSRLAAAIVNRSGDVLVRDRVATPARNVWPVVRQLVGRVMAANQTGVGPTHCGVACPGPLDRAAGVIRPLGMPVWHDFPLAAEMAELTGLPVEVDTPARALALAEQWIGEFAGTAPAEQQFAALVLGDDVDGAVVAAGRLLDGRTRNLGQFGHLIVEPGGAPCACGAVGCLTTYAGVRAIEASTGRDLRRTPPAIVERTGIMVARACASIAAMLDVSTIVIGGVVPSVMGAPFFDALAAELEQRSRLTHLQQLRVRGPGSTKIGPLASAAALAWRGAARDEAAARR
jgi:glucokinase